MKQQLLLWLALTLVVLAQLSPSALAEDAVLVLDQGEATLVWSKFVASANDLDVFDSAKLIPNVPFVTVNERTSQASAAVAAVMLYQENHGSVPISGKKGDFGLVVREAVVKARPHATEEEQSRLLLKVWRKICVQYNTDLYEAAKTYRRKTSRGEVYALAACQRLPDTENGGGRQQGRRYRKPSMSSFQFATWR